MAKLITFEEFKKKREKKDDISTKVDSSDIESAVQMLMVFET